jgi:D-galactarolactone cycloisomerase
MKITDIKATSIDIPLNTVFRGSNYQIDRRTTLIVNISTDEGIVSDIYSGDERKGYRELNQIVNGPLRDVVMGKDPLSIERRWDDMFALSQNFGNKALFMRALAAVDTALWDIAGKAMGVPVRVMLGGYCDKLPVILFKYYVEGISNEQMVEDLVRERERGIGGAKLKVGGVAISDDIARVKAIRQGLGDDFILVCDANQAWTVDEAIEFGKRAEEYKLAWLEEPVVWYDAIYGGRRVREKISIPVTAGQEESNRFSTWKLVEEKSVDILNTDASIVGGITEWRKVAAAASIKGIRMAHHEEPHSAVQLLSGIPNGLFVEIFEEARDPVYYHLNKKLSSIEGGFMKAPDGPGMGLELDKSLIERYRVA